MDKQPLLSVIVPVYNAGSFLKRCIESLQKQEYRNIEILLIDDGSKDNSPRICDDYAEKYHNIRVLHKENAGAGNARNSGLDMARGEYVAFVDADDYVDPQMYQWLMTRALEESAETVLCDYYFVRYDGTTIQTEGNLLEGRHAAQAILLGMLGALPDAKKDVDLDWSVWKAIYSRKIIHDYSIRFRSEREFLCEDLLFNIAYLLNAKDVIYVKRPLYYYCENAGSFTHKFMADRLQKEKKLYLAVKQMAGKLLQNDERLRWERLFLGRVRSTIAQYVFLADTCGFCKKIKSIRDISNDELVRSIINGYPIERNPIKLRVFNTFLKWRFCVGMYVLILLNR